jgi:hypothetical protein
MKNNNLIIDAVERLKTEETLQKFGAEEMYTLQMRDFFKMPDIDFAAVAQEDRDIRVLFN